MRVAATMTSCTTVAHIGDSTSVGLFEPEFMPDPGDALPAQYERVGVLALYTEVSGGRSTVETLGGEENAFDTVVRLRDMGYRGCWVVTLGTNDAANVAIGGVPDLTTRLDRMMFLFGSDPVLWVDAVTRSRRRTVRGHQHAGVERGARCGRGALSHAPRAALE